MSPQRTGDGLGRRAARGALTTGGGQALRLAVQMLSIVVLARLLTPQDYGLVAMVMTVASIAEIFRDFGLSAAAIQAPTLSRQQRDNLLWANTGIGAGLTAIVAACAPLVARFYQQPALVGIAQALAVTFLLNGLATQYRAGLNRDLRFASLAGIDVLAQVIGFCVGLALAASGAGYWALVGMQLAVSASALVLALAAGRWLPRLPSRGTDIRGFFRFGWHLVATQLLGYASNNVDSLIIGRSFGSEPLGLYDRAYRVLMVPLSQVRTPTTTVALPILSQLREDPERYARFVALGQLALGYTVVAGLGLALGTSGLLVPVVLGPQWTSAAPLFAVLALAGIFQTLAFVGYWVYLSRALTRQLLQYSTVSTAVKVLCVVVGSRWGVMGVAVGVAVGPGIMWQVSLWWLGRITDVPARTLWLGGLRVLAMALVGAGVSHGAAQLGAGAPALWALVMSWLAGVTAYGLLALLIPRIRADLRGISRIGAVAVSRRARRPEVT